MKTLLLAILFSAALLDAPLGAQPSEGPCYVLHKNGVTYQAWKYPNGRTRRARTIDAHGVANGVEYRWREDGTMSAIITNIDNQIAFLVSLDEGGKCRGITAYSQGQPAGPSASFYPSGAVESYTPESQQMNEESLKTLDQAIRHNLDLYGEGNLAAQSAESSVVTHLLSSPIAMGEINVGK